MHPSRENRRHGGNPAHIWAGLLLAFIIAVPWAALPPSAQGAGGADARWLGEWKPENPNMPMFLDIQAGAGGALNVSYNEGIGINGASMQVAGTPDGRTLEVTGQASGSESCTLTLKLMPGAGGRHKIAAEAKGWCANMAEWDTTTFVSATAPTYFQAGFDCNKAGTPIEHKICTTRELATADRLLSQRYRATRKALNAGQRKQLTATQRAWLQGRDRDCAGGDPATACLLAAYGTRLMALVTFPQPAVGKGEQPSFAAARRLTGNGRLDAGLRLWLGSYVGTGEALDDVSFRVKAGDTEITATGCSEPDPSRGHDPISMNCGRTYYVSFLPDGRVWAASALRLDKALVVVPPRDAGQEPASLERFRRHVREMHGAFTEQTRRP